MKDTRVCVLGGTGFVGQHLVTRLSSEGANVLVPSRNPQRHRHLSIGKNVELVSANFRNKGELTPLVQGCDAVINLIGILNERRRDKFEQIHVQLADRLIKACKRSGVKRLLHMSALNASETGEVSRYLRTKGEAENHILTLTQGQNAVQATIFRPSVIFGRNDSFFNRFASLLKIPGPLPLACPDTRFAPVYVGDVIEALMRSLTHRHTKTRSYELCGPRVFTLHELVSYTADCLKNDTPIIALNRTLSRIQARVLELVPGKPFTYDNFLSMQCDSICKKNGLSALGITPTDIDEVVPYFLQQRGERARYSELRKVSLTRS